MSREEYRRLLNALLACERAAAKLLAAYCDELPPDSEARGQLQAIQIEEARNCSILIQLLLEEGVEPTPILADFYSTGLAIRSWRDRLKVLERAQRWVANRISKDLPHLSGFLGRRALQAMRASHLANIRICERHS